jgi:hypothetical protein
MTLMKINRNGSASWAGGIKDGKGSISTESGALKALAGKAKAGCPVSKVLKADITMTATLTPA